MRTTIMKAIVVAALSFSGVAFSAEGAKDRTQPPAAQPAAPSSAVPLASTAAPAPAREAQPAPKPAKAKPPHPKNLDLRHCLDLKTDAEIAKCAGE